MVSEDRFNAIRKNYRAQLSLLATERAKASAKVAECLCEFEDDPSACAEWIQNHDDIDQSMQSVIEDLRRMDWAEKILIAS